MNIFRAGLVAAMTVGTLTAAWAADIDGAWGGQGVAQGARNKNGTCGSNPSVEAMVKGGFLQGKAVLPAVTRNFRWPVKADGSVDTDDMKGKFEGKEFHGIWTMPTQTTACSFSISLTKKG